MGRGEHTIRRLDDDVIDVVSAGIGPDLMVGARDKTEHARHRVDREQRHVGTADDRIGHRRAAVRIRCRHHRHGAAVLGNRHSPAAATAVRGDDRRLVDVADGDGDRLGRGEGSVRHLHRHVVDIVGVRIVWRLEIRDGGEPQLAGVRVDQEAPTVDTAGDAIGQGCSGIGIGATDRRDRRRILGDRDRRGRTAAIGGDGRRLVLVGNRHGQRLRGRKLPVGGLDDYLVDIVAARIERCLVVRRSDKLQDTAVLVDGEQGGIGAADDPIRDGGPRVGIRGRDRGDRRTVLDDRDGRGGPSPVRGDDRRLVDVRDGDGQRLLRGQAAVRRLDRHRVDIVAVLIERRLKVRRRRKLQHAGR